MRAIVIAPQGKTRLINKPSENMGAKDLFHEAVRRGLEKDQWTITDDSLELEWEEVKVKIDLAAERLSSIT